MTELKPYPKYKDSGVEWIGEIPEEWEITKLKFLSEIVMGQSPETRYISDRKTGFPFLQGNAEFTDVYPESKYYCNKPTKLSIKGDILLSVRAPVGEMNWSDQMYVIGRGLCAIRAIDNNVPNFLWYLLNYLRIELYSKMTGSTFEAVTLKDVRELLVMQPCKKTQEEIVAFLNQKTSQIDSLIAEKERLIKLLEEKRQAVITETVTKGLDPNVKMKDSGIEWIGEIPVHWEVKRIKYLLNEINDRNIDDNQTLLSLYTDIGVRPRKEMVQKGNKAQTIQNYKLVQKGDIVVNKLLAWMGSIGISDYNGVTSPDYDVYRAIDQNKIDSLYYHYYFRNHYFKGDCYKFGRGIMLMRWRTCPEDFKRIKVLLPPIEEQKMIINKIHTYSELILESKKKVNKQIQKLKEYRESLIYEAVTGKIDVRNYEVEQVKI